jgi:hypothetical protein
VVVIVSVNRLDLIPRNTNYCSIVDSNIKIALKPCGFNSFNGFDDDDDYDERKELKDSATDLRDCCATHTSVSPPRSSLLYSGNL